MKDSLASIATLIDIFTINAMGMTNSNFMNNLDNFETKKVLDEYKKRNIVSLPQNVRNTQIHSRTFIQQNLASEEVIKDVMNNLYNIYAGYIITSLQLERYVDNQKTLREFIEVVATENIKFESCTDILNSAMNFEMSSYYDPKTNSKYKDVYGNDEHKLTITTKTETPKPIDLPTGKIIVIDLAGGIFKVLADVVRTDITKEDDLENDTKIGSTSIDDTKSSKNTTNDKYSSDGKKTTSKYDETYDTSNNNSITTKVNNSKTDSKIKNTSFSETKTTKYTKADSFNITITLNMFLHPTIIPNSVAEQFITYNFEATDSKRYLQYSAGEISFWKDYIFQRDLIYKKRKAMIEDKTGILAEMIAKQNNALLKANIKQTGAEYYNRKNIANSILVFEKSSFERYCKDRGIRFKSYNDRQAFFAKTFSMIVVLVDNMFNQVEFYFHSIPYHGEYTYKQLKANTDSEKYDIKDFAKFFAMGQTLKM